MLGRVKIQVNTEIVGKRKCGTVKMNILALSKENEKLTDYTAKLNKAGGSVAARLWKGFCLQYV